MTRLIPAWVGGALAPVEKLEAHRRGLRHKAVSVFIHAGDEVLIQRRAMGKYHSPGLWANACCSHPDWGEAARACAERRLREELGVAAAPLRFRQTTEYRAEVGDGMVEHEVVDIFTLSVPARLPLRPEPSEVMDVAWVHGDTLRDRVRRRPAEFAPWLRIYLERGLIPAGSAAPIAP